MKQTLSFFFYSFILVAQNKPVQGIVLDSNGEPLAKVKIVSKPSETRTESNEKGLFMFNMPVKDREISLSHIEHQSKTINGIIYKNGTPIILEPIVDALDSLEMAGLNRNQFNPFDINYSIISLDTDVLKIRGYRDIVDVLFSEQSLAMNENMNGQKSLSIRATTSEEMIYLYDGIRINTLGDPMVDLSLFSTSGFSRIELVKGSHEKGLASSGTINFIPKLFYEPSFAFYQQIGTYDYGGYGGEGSIGFKNIGLSVGTDKKQFSQVYVDNNKPEINTSVSRQFAHIGLKNNHNLEGRIMGFQNEKNFYNDRTKNYVSMKLQNVMAKIIHSHPQNGYLSFFGQFQNRAGGDSTVLGAVKNNDLNQGGGFTFAKGIQNSILKFSSEINYLASDWQLNNSSLFTYRNNSIFTGSFEIRQPEKEKFFQLKNAKFVLSQQLVLDTPDTLKNISISKKNWQETSALFTASFLNRVFGKKITIYTNWGNVFRIPSLMERILNEIHSDRLGLYGLLPEQKSTYDIGLTLEKGPNKSFGTYSMSISVFSYEYSYKIKQIQLVGVPAQFPVNFGDASLSGFDGSLYFQPKRKWFQFTSTYSAYNFSDPQAFQMQPEKILHNKISFKRKWFQLDFIHRSESSRQISSLSPAGEYFSSQLEPMQAFNANLSFIMEIFGFKTNISIAGKNLNNSHQVLNGISIYDRQYNINFGLIR